MPKSAFQPIAEGSAAANEADRCVQIALSQLDGNLSDKRIAALAAAFRLIGRRDVTKDAQRRRCHNIANSQIRGDDVDDRIRIILAEIERGPSVDR